jgi:hypothetical protein
MTYLRQHGEAGRLRAVVRVVGESGKFWVHLTEADPNSRRSHDGPTWYASRDIALAAADALARHRLGGHICSAACTVWLEPLDAQ